MKVVVMGMVVPSCVAVVVRVLVVCVWTDVVRVLDDVVCPDVDVGVGVVVVAMMATVCG